MFEIIDIPQRSTEWFEFRKRHLGSADCAAILGVSPWKSAHDVWLEKTNLDLSDKYTSPAMQRGIDLEAKALECFNRYENLVYKPCVVKSTKYPWMISSLDGMFDGNSILLNEFYIVEIKCPGWEDHLTAVNGKVPEKYKAQLQHQMACTGAKEMHYFSFDGEDGVIVKVDRDESYIADLIAKEKEFWECVQTLTEPKGKYINRDDEEWKLNANYYQTLLKEKARIDRELEQFKGNLIQLAGNQSNCRGSGISLQKLTRKGTIAYATIPEVKALNLESYRSCSTEYWRIDVN